MYMLFIIVLRGKGGREDAIFVRKNVWCTLPFQYILMYTTHTLYHIPNVCIFLSMHPGCIHICIVIIYSPFTSRKIRIQIVAIQTTNAIFVMNSNVKIAFLFYIFRAECISGFSNNNNNILSVFYCIWKTRYIYLYTDRGNTVFPFDTQVYYLYRVCTEQYIYNNIMDREYECVFFYDNWFLYVYLILYWERQKGEEGELKIVFHCAKGT